MSPTDPSGATTASSAPTASASATADAVPDTTSPGPAAAPGDWVEQASAELLDQSIPTYGYRTLPVVVVVAGAGAIEPLGRLLADARVATDCAYVVVSDASLPDPGALAARLRESTSMPVHPLVGSTRLRAGHVHLVSPSVPALAVNGVLHPLGAPTDAQGRVAADLLLRTLADGHGPHATAVVLSGDGNDGIIGLRRIKERGGLTIAQSPAEAAHSTRPRAAVATGMVDWTLAAHEIAAHVERYRHLEQQVVLPPEHRPAPAQAATDAGSAQAADAPEAQHAPDGSATAASAFAAAPASGGTGLREADDEGDERRLAELLTLLRGRAGLDPAAYKRSTTLRRIRRRMQVNGVADLGSYLALAHAHAGELGALRQDFLISVTNFFRDAACFQALGQALPALFENAASRGTLRVWVAACATGEEAYSVAMMLLEQAASMPAAPAIQVFATDLDEAAVQVARAGLYPPTIEGDVSAERLRRFFVREPRGWRVRRELRESVLFAVHDLTRDSPFMRLDLVTCRNLLIYLHRDAQQRLLGAFDRALRPDGLLMLGSSEAIGDDDPRFRTVDARHRLHARRPGLRAASRHAGAADAEAGGWPPARATPTATAVAHAGPAAAEARPPAGGAETAPPRERDGWADVHLAMVERLAPPSLLVGDDDEVVHLSPTAGRYLRLGGGEPTRHVLRLIHPGLRIELLAALGQARRSRAPVDAAPVTLTLDGVERDVTMRVVPPPRPSADATLVLIVESPTRADGAPAPGPASRDASSPAPQAPHAPPAADPTVERLDRELERLRVHTRDTVEQYESSNEELKASNEELHAMNEELRSTTEELETSREELHSINEELNAVNGELKGKIGELERARNDIQNLMEATAIPTVFLDRELRVMRYTPPAVALFRLIPTDLGRPLSDLRSHFDDAQLADDARAVLERLTPLEREVAHSDGLHRFLARVLPYRMLDGSVGGVVLTFVDITERRRSQEALRRSAASFGVIVNEATVGVLQTSLDGTIAFANRWQTRMLGCTPADLFGRSLLELIHPDDRAQAAEQLKTLPERHAFRSEWRFTGRDGGVAWLQASVSLLASAGAPAPAAGPGEAADMPAPVLVICTDVSDLRLAQQHSESGRTELLTALGETEDARLALEAAQLGKDQFIAVLSHELRNPLAAIDGASRLLGSPGVAPEVREQAAQIVRRHAHSAQVLLDDLLDVSRLHLGRMRLERRAMTIGEVAETALEAVRPQALAAGHRLDVDVRDAPARLDADPVRLVQVLTNLLGNACKFTPKPGTIRLSTRIDAASGQAIFQVADTGVGLDPRQLGTIFDAFQQGTPAAAGTPHVRGLGIGLALVQRIVALHGGTVWAASDGPGRGSVFTVAMPRSATAAAAPAPALPPAPTPTSISPAVAGVALRIVVADDNEDAAWSLGQLLIARGHIVHVARSGAQALELVRDELPDVAIVDIGMPDVDGHHVARAIRAEPGGENVTVLAVTGWTQKRDRQQSLDAGFDLHLVKPLDWTQLERVLDTVAARQSAPARPRDDTAPTTDVAGP